MARNARTGPKRKMQARARAPLFGGKDALHVGWIGTAGAHWMWHFVLGGMLG